MKTEGAAFKTGAILLALILGISAVLWRHKVYRDKNPWTDPQNHPRILAEARVNGWVVETVDEKGDTYYLMGSSKYGWVIRPEDIDYYGLWRDNQWMARESQGGGGTSFSGFRGNLGPKRYPTFHREGYVELDLTVKEVFEGTTVEQLMAMEAQEEGEQP